MRKAKLASLMGALAMLATTGGPVFVIATTVPQVAQAQTQGMQRRGERRDTRQTARDTKHQCNANGGGSRSDCRQAKRGVKQAGRQN